MVLLQVANQLTYVDGATPDELRSLAKLLTYSGDDKFVMDWKTRKFKFNPAYTRHCLLEDLAFPAGLTGLVASKLRGLGIAVTIQDDRTKPAEYDLSLVDPGLKLRYYQDEGLEAALKAGRGILKLPTGAGKSLLALALISAVPVNWLFIAPNIGLVNQLAADFRKRLNIDPVVLQPSRRWKTGPITLATSTLLASRRGTPEYRALLASVGGAIGDECHRAGADGYYNVLMDCPAYYRFGLSATPGDREDDRTLRVLGAFGRIIYEQRADALVEQGYLARPKIIMHRLAQTFTAPNPQISETIGIVQSSPRNELILRIAKGITYPGLVFVQKKFHGNRLNSLFSRAGIRTRFVWGAFLESDRRQAVEDLVEGRLDLVICTKVFQEGIDIPALRSGIVATGGKNGVGTLQRLGRLTRLSDGKTAFELHDILDECAGDPKGVDNPCGNRFNAAQAQKRRQKYEDEGHEVEIR